MFCTKCGTQIPDEAAFCPNCGAPVGRKTSQVTPEPMAPKKNNQKMMIIGVCCAVVVVAAAIFGIVRLFGASSKGVSADQDTDVVTEANARTEEAYIERLEAYQVYYDSVKDEDEDYEVLAAISLDADNLPVLWLVYTDRDQLEKDDEGFYINYQGYIRAYGYEKKEVTLLAETSKYSAEYLFIDMTRQDLSFATFDDTGSSGRCGSYYEYDSDSGKFVKYKSDDEAYLTELFTRGYFTAANDEEMIYLGYWELTEEEEDDDDDDETEIDDEYDSKSCQYYWWDGTQFTADDWYNMELLMDSYDENDYDTDNDSCGPFFLNDNDFALLVRDLEENPIYDINMFAVKYLAIVYGWYYNTDYTVEYLDLDGVDEVVTDAKVDSILAEIEEAEVCDDYGDYVDVDLEAVVGYQILDWDGDGNPEVFLHMDSSANYSGIKDYVFSFDFGVIACSGGLVSYDQDRNVILTQHFAGGAYSDYVDSLTDSFHRIHIMERYSDGIPMLDEMYYLTVEEVENIFNSYLAEYSLTEFSWSSPENLEEDLRNFYQTASVNENAEAKEYVPTEAEQEVIDAKNAYVEYIQDEFDAAIADMPDLDVISDNPIKMDFSYQFINIDGDEIPEIYWETTWGAHGHNGLLTYANGEVNAIDLCDGADFYYFMGQNKAVEIDEAESQLGGDRIFHLEDGVPVIDDRASYSRCLDEDGIWSDDYIYYWNDAEVSEEDYYKYLNQAFDFDSAVMAGASWSYSELLDYLQ